MELDNNVVVENIAANEQEVGDPALNEEQGVVNEQEVGEPAKKEEKPVQSEEDNRRYAAMRRKAEADAQKKMEYELDKAIASIGFEDGYTGKIIKSKKEIDAYLERVQQDRAKAIQEKAEMTPEQYKSFIDNLPEVRRGKEAEAKLEEMKIRSDIAENLDEIRKISPEIKSVEDVQKLDKFSDIYDMVARGYRLSDAYKVMYFDSIKAKAAQAEKQKTLNSIGNKNHLQSSSPRGTADVPIPPDVLAMYHRINPKATDSEIQAHYNKYARKE